MRTASTAYRSVNRKLLISCASLAIAAAAVAPQKARAQAFNGTISSSTNASQTSAGANTETITVTNSTATINWNATSNNFLPDGNTATFTSASGVTDYTVLNRITPIEGAQIQLNGNVISTLEGTAATGGNVWFYSPGGIVVGASAKFDVGGLLLTSISPTLNSNDAYGFSASFSPAAGDGGPIQILKDAQINALQQNSYVALVAPRVEQGGNVQVNGTAAYAAGEQLTMTMNQGLFDIVVNVGTDDPNGIVHTGTTGGPASTNATTDAHRIYMIALPKNQALTMLLGGNVGFEPATVAGVENGQIVLGAGWYVTDIDDSISNFWTPSALLDADAYAGVTLGAGNYTSNVIGWIMGDLGVVADAGSISFAGFLDVGSDGGTSGNLNLGASGENGLSIGDYLSFYSSSRVTGSANKSIFADSGGALDINGNLYLSGVGGNGPLTVEISADNGSINVGGSSFVDASGDGHGGYISIHAEQNGSIAFGEYANFSANGWGAGETLDATGGVIDVYAGSGGALRFDGGAEFDAFGFGLDDAGFGAGDGTGGWVDLHVGGGSINVAGGLYANADGYGGEGQAGGNGYGGHASIYGDDGTIGLGAFTSVSARGTGGSATSGFGGNGGYGQGGYASIEARANPITEGFSPTAATITGGDAFVDASGTGGAGGAGDGVEIGPGAGGDGQGGVGCGECGGGAYVLADVNGATLDLGNVNVISNGNGGTGGAGGAGQAGGTGGNGYGGSSQVALIDPYNVGGTSGSITLASLVANSIGNGGLGGSGGSGGNGGDGGDGQGGDVLMAVPSSTLDVTGAVDLHSRGVGGVGGVAGTGGAGGGGGNGAGGAATLDVWGHVTTGDLVVRAVGEGGNGGDGTDGGDGGNGTGSFSNINIYDGGILTSADIENRSRGFGGDGGNGTTGFGGDGGNAFGSTNFLTVASGGQLIADNYLGSGNAPGGYDIDPETQLVVSTGGNGGTGDSGSGAGGDATSGSGVGANIAGTATITGNFVTTTYAQGGNGSTGGNATAGTSSITVDGSLTAGGTVQASAQGQGGDGDQFGGGDGQGGSSTIQVNGTLDAGQINVLNRGWGGDGVTAGGDGYGGLAYLYSDGAGIASATANSDTSAPGLIQLLADATGGIASGGTDGIASGGTVTIATSNGGTITTLDLSLSSYGDLNVPTIGGDIAVTGALKLSSNSNIVFGDVTAGRLKFDADGSVTGGDINVTDRVDGGAQGAVLLGDITAGPGLPTGDGNASVAIKSETSITVGNITAAGDVGFATYGGLTAGNISAGDLILAMVGGDMTFGSLTTAADGRVYLADVSMFAIGGGVCGGDECDFDPSIVLALAPVATGGSITINGTVTTGQFQAAAGTDLSINDAAVTDSVELYAGGIANFYGTVSAPTITVSSGDINVAEGAQLGVWGVTDTLTLNAVTDGNVYIGAQESPPLAGDYFFNEAGDIAGTNITFNAIGASENPAPDIIVGSANIDGSQSEFPAVSHVTLNSDGSIIVQGLVNFQNAGAGDSLTLNAGNAIEVITDTGGIAMTDANGGLAGTLELTAHDIWVADQSVLGQLEQDPNPANLADLLATNNGADNQGGYLQAGGITATMLGSSFLVQNSGTVDNLAGLTVGDGGLTIVNDGVDPANTIVYGRQVQSNGTVVSGAEFASSAQTSGSFTSNSTVNNCAIGGCAPPPPPPPPPPPVRRSGERG
jgi:filamentous hemagglutinin family protein